MGLFACGTDKESQPKTFSQAVEQVAVHGGNVAIQGFDCEFGQLDSASLEVKRVFADEADFTGAVIADKNGAVAEYGNVQCIIQEEGQLVIRGANGY